METLEGNSIKPKFETGLSGYYHSKLADLQVLIAEKGNNLRRLEAQRNQLNGEVRQLKEELQRLQEPPANVGEVIKVMGKPKALVKLQPDGKFSVDIDKAIDPSSLKAGMRVALKSDTYKLFKVLPSKVDPLVSLMMVEKVPDATYDMIGGLENQIKEIKEVLLAHTQYGAILLIEYAFVCRLSSYQLSILNFLRVWELPSQRVSSYMGPPALVKPCWLVQLLTTPIVVLSAFLARSSFRSTSVRVVAWFASSSSWPVSMPLPSSLWTRSIPLGAAVLTAVEATMIARCNAPC